MIYFSLSGVRDLFSDIFFNLVSFAYGKMHANITCMGNQVKRERLDIETCQKSKTKDLQGFPLQMS